MLLCADKSYYIRSHRGNDPSTRVWAHNEGVDPSSYTFKRRPVELVWSEWFDRYDEMVARERQIKGWSRKKKEALIRGDGGALRALSARGVRPSLASDPSRRLDHLTMVEPPQDEGVSSRRNDISPHPEGTAEGGRLEGWMAGKNEA